MNVTLNIANWSYADLSDFAKAIGTGNQEAAFAKARKIIVDWEYDVDLNDDDAMNELGMLEGIEVMEAINTTIAGYLNNSDVSDYKVNFKKWKNKDFFAFNEARREGNAAVIERMLRDVVEIPGASDDRPLSAVQGSLAIRAVNKAYERRLNGKN